ncbi:MAG TPA: heavy-metal-associated domain-containing protein [Acholeplasma sp.]|nr:heavy-metal-associated domain-containing protein [Acholeplasma sp.]
MEKIIVKDMSCMSCVKTVQTVLAKNNIEAKINLMKNEVLVPDESKDLAFNLIKQAGYNPENA